MMELADVLDSKSSGSDTVRVRPPLPAPNGKTPSRGLVFFALCRRELMKFTFLGTGAAQNNKTPEEKIGEGRRCSTLLVDESLLVDVAPQSFDFAEKLELDTSAVSNVLLTHSHDDHFNLSQLVKFAMSAGHKIKVWCHCNAAKNMEIGDDESRYISFEYITEMETVAVGDYMITALPANHEMPNGEQAFHYIIEKNGKTIFYGCDGGWFFGRTWKKIVKTKFDCMILECTVGDNGGDVRLGGHNTMPMLELLAMGIRENNVLKEKGIIIASHIGNLSHDRLPHEKIAEKMARFGVVAAHDGMGVEI